MGHRRNCRARHDSPWREHRRAQRRSTGRVLASHATPCPGGLALRTTRTAGSGRGWRVLITRTQRSGHQALTRRVPQPEPGCAARDRRVRVSCPEPTSGHPRIGASPTRRVNTWPSMSPGSHRFSRTTGTDRQQTAPRLPHGLLYEVPPVRRLGPLSPHGPDDGAAARGTAFPAAARRWPSTSGSPSTPA